MKFVLTLLLGLCGPSIALAGSAWYGKPQANVRVVRINENTVIQASAGGEVGLRYGLSEFFKGRTRLGAIGLYGLNTNTLGADLRLGTFLGPAGRTGFLQIGPDLWMNGYDGTDEKDYKLVWSQGLSITTTGSLTLHPSIRLIGAISPGWAFNPVRQRDGLGPFDELNMMTATVISGGDGHLTIGYQQSWNSAGIIQGLILSGGL
jgi:hypothetical protein